MFEVCKEKELSRMKTMFPVNVTSHSMMKRHSYKFRFYRFKAAFNLVREPVKKKVWKIPHLGGGVIQPILAHVFFSSFLDGYPREFF